MIKGFGWAQRFAAWRSDGIRSTNVQFSTNVNWNSKCSI